MQGVMTEAMKNMDSGMSAAEMELRAARRAVPAAVPADAGTPQQPSPTPGSNSSIAAPAASRDPAESAVQQSQESVATHLPKLDSLQAGVQQHTPSSHAGQAGDQPAPAASGSHDHAQQRGRNEAGENANATAQVCAAIKGVLSKAEAGSDAEPAGGRQPQQSSGPAALDPAAAPVAQQSHQPDQVQAAADTSQQPCVVKIVKQVSGVQLHIHADSSAAQPSLTQPVSTISNSGTTSPTSCLSAAVAQTTAESNAPGVSQTSTLQHNTAGTSLPTSDGSTHVQSCGVYSSVQALTGTPEVPRVGGVLSPTSSAESASGEDGSTSAVSPGRPAVNVVLAVASTDTGAASRQQNAAVEPWAADEGDFASMLKKFLVSLAAVSAMPFVHYITSQTYTVHARFTTACCGTVG